MKMRPPTPFSVVRDTREQKPLIFPPELPVVTDTCYPGDYSAVGLRRRFVVERKGVSFNHGRWTSDLVATITELLRGQRGDFERGSLRFRYELDAMRTINRNGGMAFVATDKPRSWYEAHCYYGGLKPTQLFGTISSLEAEYGVCFQYFENADQLAVEVMRLSMEFWKHHNGVKSYVMDYTKRTPAAYAKWKRERGGL